MGKNLLSMRCLLVLVLFTAGSCDARAQSAKEKREAAYQAKLQSYSDVLKPGMTRKNVEDYLREKGWPQGLAKCYAPGALAKAPLAPVSAARYQRGTAGRFSMTSAARLPAT